MRVLSYFITAMRWRRFLDNFQIRELESRDFHAVGNAEDPLLRRKFADFIPLEGRSGDGGVSGAYERQSRVSPGVFEKNVLAARMTPHEFRAVVHVIVYHQPAVVERVVPSNLVQSDRS